MPVYYKHFELSPVVTNGPWTLEDEFRPTEPRIVYVSVWVDDRPVSATGSVIFGVRLREGDKSLFPKNPNEYFRPNNRRFDFPINHLMEGPGYSLTIEFIAEQTPVTVPVRVDVMIVTERR